MDETHNIGTAYLWRDDLRLGSLSSRIRILKHAYSEVGEPTYEAIDIQASTRINEAIRYFHHIAQERCLIIIVDVVNVRKV